MREQHIALLLVLSPAWGWQDRAPSLEAMLSAPVGSYSLTADRPLDGLLKAATAFHIPLGIEWIKAMDPAPGFVGSWRQTTALAILRDIAKADPGYELEVGDGIVHVFPAAMRGDPSDVLNFRLESVKIDDTINVAAVNLMSRVKPVMTPPRPSEPTAVLGGSILEDGGARAISVASDHATVREILDRLCLESGRGAWVVAYPPVPGKTRAGFLKTVWLEKSIIVEDGAFFPSWRFLHWGEMPAVRD